MTDGLRTKPTVEAGITTREDFPGGSFVVYQPGDGRRYSIVFTQVPETVTKAIGAQPRSCIVSILNFHCTMIVALDHGYLAARYVREKMPILGEHSAHVVAEIIAYMTGRQADGPGGEI